jgi:hypothetical protein
MIVAKEGCTWIDGTSDAARQHEDMIEKYN